VRAAARVPDAVPRVEPLRAGGPNRPYAIAGRRHVPITDDRPLAERGGASWYGRKFHGRPTSSGEPYDMYGMTAAHRTMPIPSYARVRNPANGREVIVRVNDRGPFVDGRVIDLSYTAALKLGVLGGPFASRAQAEDAAARLRELTGLAALVVERP
jgi:rare lipoprotein A